VNAKKGSLVGGVLISLPPLWSKCPSTEERSDLHHSYSGKKSLFLEMLIEE